MIGNQEIAAVVDSDGQQLVIPAARGAQGEASLSLDQVVTTWLHENGWRPDPRECSRTGEEYAATLTDFRMVLQAGGYDLDSPAERTIGLLAQGWAARARRRDGRPVSNATHNRRLAILSSFYAYARRFGLEVTHAETGQRAPIGDPASLVKRRKVQAYAAARPLERQTVTAALSAIDRTTPAGKRDYALLVLALNTGRRVSELAALVWGDVLLTDGSTRATVTWRHCKGGKVMHDRLDPAVTAALLEWMYAVHGAELGTLAPTMPLWLALSRNTRGRQQAMSSDAIADVWAKRLGTSKVHSSRHTFADAMARVGAPVRDIQARLGHASLDTTSRYLEQMASSENTHAGALAEFYGIAPARRAAKVTRPLRRDPEAQR